MPLADGAVLMTGANRGIGQALVDEALSRGGKRVSGTRQPLPHADGRVTPSLSQSLRALLSGRGVRVHAALTGQVDTDMTRGIEIPKASPESVARAIVDGEMGEEIFPDPMSASVADRWRAGAAKTLERQNVALLEAEPVKS
jgi:NAD(P)-dependent dehydrogenase (short-subunit alcohol dehydrogenase family)